MCTETQECLRLSFPPNGGVTNFDNILYAFINIFQVMTQQGWTDVMYALQSSLSFQVWIYFVVLNFIGPYFVIQLFLVVISKKYAEVKEQTNAENAKIVAQALQIKTGKVHPDKQAIVVTEVHEEDAAAEAEEGSGKREEKRSFLYVLYQKILGKFQRVAASALLEGIVMLAIVVNTILMAIDSDCEFCDEASCTRMKMVLELSNIVFTSIFTFEMVIKIAGFGLYRYLWTLKFMTWLDVIIVGTSLAEIPSVLDTSQCYLETKPCAEYDYCDGGGGTQVLRIVRLLRILKLLSRFKSFQKQLSAIGKTFMAVSSLIFLILIFITIFVILGGTLLAGLVERPWSSQDLFRGLKVFVSVPGDDLQPTSFPIQGRVATLKEFDRNATTNPWRICFNYGVPTVLQDVQVNGCVWGDVVDTAGLHTPAVIATSERDNFDFAGVSFLTVLGILTTSNWNSQYYNAAICFQPSIIFYYIAWIFVGNWVLFNVFIAILIQGISDEKKTKFRQQEEKMAEQIKYFFEGLDAKQIEAQTMEWFREVDRDGSGEIDMNELEQVLVKKFGIEMNPRELIRLFRKYDDDDSGFIGKAEFKNMIKELLEMSEAKVKQLLLSSVNSMFGTLTEKQFGARMIELFKEADADCSGEIDAKELTGVLTKYDIELTLNDVKKLLQRFDSDDSGLISQEEFSSMMQRLLDEARSLELGSIVQNTTRKASMVSFGLHRASVWNSSNANSAAKGGPDVDSGAKGASTDSAGVQSLPVRSPGGETIHGVRKMLMPPEPPPEIDQQPAGATSSRRGDGCGNGADGSQSGSAQVSSLGNGFGAEPQGAMAESPPPPEGDHPGGPRADSDGAEQSAEQAPPVQPSAAATDEEEEEASGPAKRSLFCLGLDNPLRRACIYVLDYPPGVPESRKFFDNFILVCILVSSAALAFESPRVGSRSSLRAALDGLNIALNFAFLTECFLKIVAESFFGYLKSGWSRLDFFIVITSMLDMIMGWAMSGQSVSILKTFRILRILRSLRPLRLIARAKSLRLLITALWGSVIPIMGTCLIALVAFAMCSLLGMQLLRGKIKSCSDPTYVRKADCLAATDSNGIPLSWASPSLNWDSLFNGMAAMFILASQDNWQVYMFQGVDSVTRVDGPSAWNSPLVSLFYVFCLLVSSFLVINLVIGVFIDAYYTAASKMEMDDKATREPRVPFPPIDDDVEGAGRLAVSDVVSTNGFDMFIAFFIVTNIMTMGFESYKQSSWQTEFGAVSNFFFSLVFGWECLFKVYAYCPKRYYRAGWNKFDFFIVMVCFGGILIDGLGTAIPMDPRTIRVLRLFRVFRILRAFRILKAAKGLTRIVGTLAQSLPALRNLMALLSLQFFIFGVLGVSLFGGLCVSGEEASPGLEAVRCMISADFLQDPKVNLRDLGHALITLFRVATTDGWSQLMYSLFLSAKRGPLSEGLWRNFMQLNGTGTPPTPAGVDYMHVAEAAVRGWMSEAMPGGQYTMDSSWPFPTTRASEWGVVLKGVLGPCITDEEATHLESKGLMDCTTLGNARPCSSTCTDAASGYIFFFIFTLISAFFLMQLVIAVLLQQLMNSSEKEEVHLRTPGCENLKLKVFGRMHRRWRFTALQKLRESAKSARRTSIAYSAVPDLVPDML